MKRHAIVILMVYMLVIPVALAVTIDGPTNFVATNGGIVRFNPATISSNIVVNGGLYRYSGTTIAGSNRGTLAFDCSTGTTMTILTISRYQITYTVAAAGASTQYVYYANNMLPPQGTNTDTVNYNAATGITTVTTTGNVTVTLDYATLSGMGITGLEAFLALLPIVALLVSMELRKHDLISNNIVLMILVFAVAAIIVIAIRTMGY